MRPSPMMEQLGFMTASLPEATSSSPGPVLAARTSPQVPMSPSFPPPPSAQASRLRERSASGQRLFSSIHSLTSRGKQATTAEIHSNPHLQHPQPLDYSRPPAARRAASTGHISPANSSSSARALVAQANDLPDTSSWHPGMPLPGPPPGPPPPGARSQSLNRFGASSSQVQTTVEAPQPSRRTAVASTLGPVPPTPADWDENDPQPELSCQDSQEAQSDIDRSLPPLRIHTGARDTSLSRRPATRESSAQGLRERRSKSKAARDGSSNAITSPVSDDVRPVDQISSTITGAISQRREHMRKASTYADVGQKDPGLRQDRHAKRPETGLATVMTPPYTPAVGDGAGRRQAHALNSASGERPESHDEDNSAKMPIKLDSFYRQALERHRNFIEKESMATTDEEKLEMFTNYIVHESRLRRDRYSTAYNAMAGEIVDLTRDLWRSFSRASKRAVTSTTSMSSFDPTAPSYTSSDGLPSSAQGEYPRSGSSMGDFTPATDTASMSDSNEALEHTDSSRQWGETFKPCLSPIPSMAVSTVADEADSRGRTASRWWEKSEASGSIGKPERIEKSHRETKYMGVTPATLRDVPQPSPEAFRQTPTPGASTFVFGPNEYPPEKTGWHEDGDHGTPLATPGNQQQRARKPSDTGALEALEVSRLVTLPPPFPRHHPAVNNKHPLLSDLRNEYRRLADGAEVQRIRDANLDHDWSMKRAHQETAKQRRSQMRRSMQEKLNGGEISFADAAKAEAQFEADEIERGKADARAIFDAFEASVSHPLNNIITARLATAEKCLVELRRDLERHNESPDPNRAQEEGDEHPERLEKLTLLKWLFEAREQLHKEMFDLHAQRAEKYGDVVVTPYRMAKQQGKIDEAEAFFRKDGRQRAIGFAGESLKRFEAFLRVVEANVTSGVEDQLSAFWDIAPGLREVVQQIPSTVGAGETARALGRLEIMIPPQEYEENPALKEFPLQYLYSLLSHAERSAYQFIESQINLLCLLHEVRGATAQASLRLIEVERSAGDKDVQNAEAVAEMALARRAEEIRLTADLQEKVGEVEKQWKGALGERLLSVKSGVKRWLEDAGGWEDGLDG